MKDKEKIKTEKSYLEQLREIRDKLSLEMKDMNLDEIKRYIDSKETLHPKTVWKSNAD